MTITKIISQVLNGLGSALNMYGINLKDKNRVLKIFTIGNLLVAISLGLLGATVGMLAQLSFVIETLINYFWEKRHNKYPILLILLYIFIPSLILGISFTSCWDILPIIASILFVLAFISKNFVLRLLNLLSAALWIPYNFHFGQYVGIVSCTVFTIMNLIAIIRLDILENKKST